MSLNRSPKMLAVTIQYAKRLRKQHTKSETLLWLELRGRKLDKWRFVRQRPILIDLNGIGTFAIADFYCPAAKLVVEIDGPIHGGQKLQDEARDRALAERGYDVIRIPAEQVEHNIQQVLERINYEVQWRAATRSRTNIPLLLI
jgi:very-short-patch-repair endonuclease